MMKNFFYVPSFGYYNLLVVISSCYFIFLLKGVSFSFDFFSYSLVMLTLWVGLMMVLAGLSYTKFYSMKFGKVFLFFFMILFLLFAFSSKNFFSFYVFFELSMIPILMYIMGWGTDLEKWQASLLMFLFTYVGSVFYLFAILSSYYELGTLSFFLLEFLIEKNYSILWVFSFISIFLIKLPVFYMHVWLPMAHVESPLMGSMILAGVMLKLGGYGLMKFLDCFYFSFMVVKDYLIVLGLIGGIMAAIDCIFQVDYKRVVALSSVSHMSMVVAAIATGSYLGKWGAFSLMMSHGISSSAFFYSLGVLYYRFHSRANLILRGLISVIPLIGIFWFMLFMYNLAFPPLIPFMAEVSMLWSVYSWSSFSGLFISFLIMISSIYTVFLYTQFISNKSKSDSYFFSISVMELMIMLFHLFGMLGLTFLVWFW